MFQKNRFLFVLLFAVQSLFAQIPQGFNYQATVRNQTGELLTNEYVGFKFHILQGSSDATPTYSELHYISTDDLGVVHLSIGSGNAEAGAFSQIDWSLGNYHMGIEINTGDGFIDMGTTQLMSVPFALYALNSGTTNNASLPQGNTVGDVLSWNGSAWTVPVCSSSPTLRTNEVSNITDTSVTFSGTIEAPTCDPSVTSQGFVYGLNTLPKTTDEVIEVAWTSPVKKITGLQQNQTYYCRTFFTNPTGTYYGNELMFQTNIGPVLLNSEGVTNIKAFSADVYSDIYTNGGAEITARGVCWSTNPNPTIADSKTEEGSGLGGFSSSLTGLTKDTTYNVRSYATNEAGTTYGEQVAFTTQDGIVSFATTSISNIRMSSATIAGNITDDGGAAITARGVCWSTNPNPTIADSKTEEGSGLGGFSSSLTGLTEDTTYNVRSYATNEAGTSYSEEVNFKTIENPVYLDANGITVKARDWAGIGAKGMLNGVEYTVIDSNTLRNMIFSGEDVTTVCTSIITGMPYMFSTGFNEDISTWDVSNVTDMNYMFSDANSFNQDLSAWDVSNVTSMSQMFYNASSFNQDLSSWDVSNVTTMSWMFSNATSFNQDLSAWDVSNVTNMSSMFQYAQNFNQDLSAWDVSNVVNWIAFNESSNDGPTSWTLPKPSFGSLYLDANGITVKAPEDAEIGSKGMVNGIEYTVVDDETLRGLIANGEDVTTVCTSRITTMSEMFYFSGFNQDLSAWDVSNVTDMSGMFNESSFNQDLSTWDVSNVTNMSSMFQFGQFNQDLSAWDVSNVTTMSEMFNFSGFNQDLSTWDVRNVTNMSYMFSNNSFNQDLSAWDVSNVTDMSGMFNESSFNQDLSTWDVSNVTTMKSMFSMSSFNQDLSAWDVRNVTNMSNMFSDTSYFNQDLSAWDVSNVTNMSSMFQNASSFNQDLSAWDVSNVTTMEYMFYEAQNFNQDLSAWDVSNVTTMEYMFYEAQNFNQDLSAWDVSNVTTMEYMFYNAYSFNQDLSAWDVSNVVNWINFNESSNDGTPSWTLPKPSFGSLYIDANGITVKAPEDAEIGSKGMVNGIEYTVVDINTLRNRIEYGGDVTTVCTSRITDMSAMFGGPDSFNQDISAWDVSNVTTMSGMFSNSYSFNQDLSAWDVRNVTDMSGMFNESSFNQDLSAWDVSNVTECWGIYGNNSWTQPKPNFTNNCNQ